MPTGIDSSRMLNIAPAIGVGVSDLQQAVRAEVDRISKETKGVPSASSLVYTSRDSK
jgi:hypothetical protein